MTERKQNWKLIVTVAVVLVGVCVLAAVKLINKPADADAAHSAQWDAATREKLRTIHQSIGKYLSDNDVPKALLIAQALSKEYPGDLRAWEMLTEIYARQNRFDDAYASVTNALKIDPNGAEDQFLAGVIAGKTGNVEKARYHFTQASVLSPETAKYPMYLAETLLRMNDIDAAQLQLLRAARLDSTVPQINSMLAEIASRRGKLPMAVDYINKAVDAASPSDPNRVKYIVQKAMYLRRSGDPQSALDSLSAIDPAKRYDPSIVEQYAQCYQMMSNPAAAGDLWAEAFTRDPSNAHAAAEAGLNYHKAGNDKTAARYLSLAKRINGNHPTVLALEEAMGEKK